VHKQSKVKLLFLFVFHKWQGRITSIPSTLEAKDWKRTSCRWLLAARMSVTVLLFQDAPSKWASPFPAARIFLVAVTTRFAALCLR